MKIFTKDEVYKALNESKINKKALEKIKEKRTAVKILFEDEIWTVIEKGDGTLVISHFTDCHYDGEIQIDKNKNVVSI